MSQTKVIETETVALTTAGILAADQIEDLIVGQTGGRKGGQKPDLRGGEIDLIEGRKGRKGHLEDGRKHQHQIAILVEITTELLISDQKVKFI